MQSLLQRLRLHAPRVYRIKAYESKFATLAIVHGAVQKENEQLRTEVKQAQQPGGIAEEELVELKEEFSKRLGAADQTIARLQASTRSLQCTHCFTGSQ